MTLSPKKRIFLNIVVTYGRTLLGTICGIFTARWALMALGEVDFGLFGVVGGLAVFISFFNGILATATGRFYAFSVGESKKSGQDGLEKCRQWFNTALLLHIVVPLIFAAVGYPVGVYAIERWLTIPPDRIAACVWVFRFACISCLVSMMSVPFNAMYYAKQYIAELTVYTMLTLILNVVVLYYMVTHPGVWLTQYAFWTCFTAVLPQILITFRSLRLFPECRFKRSYLWDGKRTKELLNFAGWHFFGAFGSVASNQGVAILVNKYFGPSVNAAATISGQLAGQCNTLSGSIMGAFSPAITDACGEGNKEKMQRMAFAACKYCTLMTLFFAIPLALELSEVLRIWLKEPPQYAAGLCLCGLIFITLNNISCGYWMAISAVGKIAAYQMFCGTMILLTLPFAWLFVVLGWGVYSIGYASILSAILLTAGRVHFARRITGMSAEHWMKHIFFPIVLLCLTSVVLGSIPRFFLENSLVRIFVTLMLSDMTLLVLAWSFLLNKEERCFLQQKFSEWRSNAGL